MAHEHDHGELHYQGAEVQDEILATLRALHPALAETLDLTRRWSALDEKERQLAQEKQREVEAFDKWTPGYHADGDACATCGGAVDVLFHDRFQEGALPYAAYVAGLPVHAQAACIDGFDAKHPKRAPQVLDRARRGLMKDLNRPSPGITQFFRHDVLAHPPFGLEDWANSVAHANEDISRARVRDIERLLHWAHARLFHH